MGNMKLPRPTEINFPEVKEKNWKITIPTEKEVRDDRKQALNICILKSGNILLAYLFADREKMKFRSFLCTYDFPDLNLVEKYEYDGEIGESLYMINFAWQAQDGNIFTIGDKLYFFDGESISKGPVKSSEKIHDGHFHFEKIPFRDPYSEYKERIINKTYKYFICRSLLEVKEGIYLYAGVTDYSYKYLSLLDLSESKIEKNEFFSYEKMIKGQLREYELAIVKLSKYYPENLYIIANIDLHNNEGYQSELLCFNIEKFIANKSAKFKEPLFSILTSKSQSIIGFCEYDKKYILLDSYQKGIYIIDIELKQKVAVSVPKNSLNYKFTGGGYSVYGDIIKLKDGQVFIDGKVINVREQKYEDKVGMYRFREFLLHGDYIIYLFKNTSIFIYKIEER